LQSIKQYMVESSWSDEFYWNHGVSLAAVGKYAEAEEALLRVRSPSLTSDATFVSWLARCHVMCRRGRAAWELYLRAAEDGSGPAALSLLRLLAGDCFATGQFFVAALAYDSLERHFSGGGEGAEEAWAGKAAACAGVLHAVASGAEARECLREVHAMLVASAGAAPLGSTVHVQGEALARAIQKWAASQK
jgi:intraflagellar transport protein 56